MGTIGMVSGSIDKEFSGEIRTLSTRASVEIRPNRGKGRAVQPDYRIWPDDVEIGAGYRSEELEKALEVVRAAVAE